jgi:hypothetical protein
MPTEALPEITGTNVAKSTDNLHDFDNLTQSYVRLANLPLPARSAQPLEATLWRQACQIMFTLQFMTRPRRWGKARLP